MNKIKIIKWVKANFIRFKLHRVFGVFDGLLIYFGYLIKLSRWVDKNKKLLESNDFYNNSVKHADRELLYAEINLSRGLGDQKISFLEFGVASGNSFKWWMANNHNPESEFWGFDTFTGLPEAYGSYAEGGFDQKGNFPNVDDSRANFVKGLFQDTLVQSLSKISMTNKLVIHMDADLYTATLYILSILEPHMKSGDVIIFDEFGVPGHEFKAYLDFISSYGVKLKPFGAINNYLQVAFEIE